MHVPTDLAIIVTAIPALASASILVLAVCAVVLVFGAIIIAT